MTGVLPTVSEAKQLQRLRALRVQRAREECSRAAAAVVQAEQAVAERQRAIERNQRAIKELAQAVVSTLAPSMPRWCDMVAAQRNRLADRLERDEDALISDEQSLELAQEKSQQARAELTRALAREDAAQGLTRSARRARAQAIDRRVELEVEEVRRPAVRA
jgi:leucyl-tRNA synthetase